MSACRSPSLGALRLGWVQGGGFPAFPLRHQLAGPVDVPTALDEACPARGVGPLARKASGFARCADRRYRGRGRPLTAAPHRSTRAPFPHVASTLNDWRQSEHFAPLAATLKRPSPVAHDRPRNARRSYRRWPRVVARARRVISVQATIFPAVSANTRGSRPAGSRNPRIPRRSPVDMTPNSIVASFRVSLSQWLCRPIRQQSPHDVGVALDGEQ